MPIVAGKEHVPIIDGKPLDGVVAYKFEVRVDEVVTLTVELLPEWIPPTGEAEILFDLSSWSQRGRDALRAALEEADVNAKRSER